MSGQDLARGCEQYEALAWEETGTSGKCVCVCVCAHVCIGEEVAFGPSGTALVEIMESGSCILGAIRGKTAAVSSPRRVRLVSSAAL